MSRLIYAEEAIDYVNNLITVHRYYHPRSTTENFPISEVIAKINEVPTIDAVPVVRCGECRHKRLEHDVWMCRFGLLIPSPDGFCSYGEKVTE